MLQEKHAMFSHVEGFSWIPTQRFATSLIFFSISVYDYLKLVREFFSFVPWWKASPASSRIQKNNPSKQWLHSVRRIRKVFLKKLLAQVLYFIFFFKSSKGSSSRNSIVLKNLTLLWEHASIICSKNNILGIAKFCVLWKGLYNMTNIGFEV